MKIVNIPFIQVKGGQATYFITIVNYMMFGGNKKGP